VLERRDLDSRVVFLFPKRVSLNVTHRHTGTQADWIGGNVLERKKETFPFKKINEKTPLGTRLQPRATTSH
jgi:hypothetical protein